MDAVESDSGELDRLRRQLRAQSAVNRQLHAQLDGGSVRIAASGRPAGDGDRKALSVRRVSEGASWVDELHLHGGGDPFLVRTPTMGVYVVEGKMRRQVKAGVLVDALLPVLGAAREMTDRDLERWTEGPPVEVMESGSGPAFLIVAGRRLPLRGLPLPYLVSGDDMLLFPEGEELRVASGRTAPPSRAALARTVLHNDGPVRGSVKLARKAWRRVLG